MGCCPDAIVYLKKGKTNAFFYRRFLGLPGTATMFDRSLIVSGK